MAGSVLQGDGLTETLGGDVQHESNGNLHSGSLGNYQLVSGLGSMGVQAATEAPDPAKISASLNRETAGMPVTQPANLTPAEPAIQPEYQTPKMT